MADKEHLNRLWQGVSAWNAWRQEHPAIKVDLREADLRWVNLSGADLSGATFIEADLTGANLSGADLREAVFTWAQLEDVDLGGRDLSKADFSDVSFCNTNLRGANLSRAILRNAKFVDTDLSGADLSGATLDRAVFRKANLSKANLSGARLSATIFWDANLSGVDLSGRDLQKEDFSRVNLSGANLSGANLSEVDLSRQDLGGRDLSGANLNGVDLRQANLIEAKLNGATLTDACLWESQRAGWSIQGIICEAIYWDKDRQERKTYSPGEFEKLHADQTKIILNYPGGISAIEIATLPALIQQMEVASGCVLRLQSMQEAPSGGTITLVLDDTGGRNAAELTELKANLEVTGKRLQGFQRKLSEEASTRNALEAEISRMEKVFARLYLEQEERKLLSPTDARTQALTVMFLDLVGFSKLSEEDRQAKVDMLRSLGVALQPC